MAEDRIRKVRIRGLRVLKDVEVALDGLTVLIGDNGSGKSTLIEAIALLQGLSAKRTFTTDILVREHGGAEGLLRQGETDLSFQVQIGADDDPKRVEYTVDLKFEGSAPEVVSEQLLTWSPMMETRSELPNRELVRSGNDVRVWAPERLAGSNAKLDKTTLALTAFGIGASTAMQRMIDALERIAVHVPFETRPLWLFGGARVEASTRVPVALDRASQLERFGFNLPNCLNATCKQDIRSTIAQRVAAGHCVVLLEQNTESLIDACCDATGKPRPSAKLPPDERDRILVGLTPAQIASVRKLMPSFDYLVRKLRQLLQVD